MFQPHLILHPTDFSEGSSVAFQIAVDLARQNQAALLVLHVVETLGPENATYGEITSQLQPQGYEKRLEETLGRLAPTAEEVSIQYLFAEGEPATEIDRIARERGCDLIVLGTHGRTGLKRLLMGSIAEKVVRLAACPVLTLKIPIPASASHSPGYIQQLGKS
jgi:nucleotide-binding universal stress UspA family protein